MTERKKLGLSKPAQTDADSSAPGADGPRRKPPVRGSGTAPRKRMTAAEAAQAREEAAKREAAAERGREAWRNEQRGDDRGPARGMDRRGDAPRSERRSDRPGEGQPARQYDRPQRDDRGRYQSQGPQPHQDARQEPRQAPRSGPRRDASPGQRPGARADDRPGQRPGFDDRGGPRSDHGQGRDERYPERRDGRRADGHVHPKQGPAQAQPSAAPREDDGRMRLSKLMSEKGLASRREADEWIEQGWVRVDGQVVAELGSRVFPDQVITIDPLARSQQAQQVTIVIHKPIGYVSGQAEDGYEPAVVLITPENRWADDKLPIQLTRGHLRHLAPAGRLDIDSTGMLVLTQDGRVAKALIGEDSGVEKEYLVRVEAMDAPEAENVSAVVSPEAIDALRFGLELDGRQLKPAQVSWQNEQQLRFVLREGRKRQIRRMCELVGLKVTGLKRVRMGRITLGKLPLGQWRFLRPDERF
jgi:23S rRNA pseudouridine2604 synthase